MTRINYSEYLTEKMNYLNYTKNTQKLSPRDNRLRSVLR